MSGRLVEDPDAVAVLAGQVADATGIPAAHIEKDFWVTEVLRGVVAAATEQSVEVLFKGGTSLSKVFSMIDRFSEDVDMLVVLPAGSAGAQDRVLKDLAEGARRSTGIVGAVDGSASTKGVKRSVRFHYRDLGGGDHGLTAGVLLELGTRGGALGSTRAVVRSLIAEHVEEIAAEPEVAPVEVRVLAPWRTLAEKLVLLHTAHTSPEPTAAVKGARHFYDVHRLLDRPEVRSGVAEAGIGALARDVCTYSRAAGLPADRPTGCRIRREPRVHRWAAHRRSGRRVHEPCRGPAALARPGPSVSAGLHGAGPASRRHPVARPPRQGAPAGSGSSPHTDPTGFQVRRNRVPTCSDLSLDGVA